MSKKQAVFTIGILTALSCMMSSVAAVFLFSYHFGRSQYRILSGLTESLIREHPQEEQEIMRLVKAGIHKPVFSGEEAFDYLEAYGYRVGDFASGYGVSAIWAVILGAAAALLLFFCLFGYYKHILTGRVRELTGYLEKMNRAGDASILSSREDFFAPLQDELYKTVTNLRIARETAVKERRNFADNLANIAHQVKTPVASLSIGVQLLEKEHGSLGAASLKKQISRLEQLVEALLTLSRIDAGVLELEKREVDVYTLLVVSAEAVEELTGKKNVQVKIPNHPEITFQGDLEWSIEAFINLLKNCGEHTPEGGRITAEYSNNPLYTEIIITDEGDGFLPEELPRVFERFYRGQRAGGNGVGIGLPLAKSLIEMQNGFVTAGNRPEGGAVFTVRFYRH